MTSTANQIYPQEKYCVYLTVYTGSKLPMFYIGSVDVKSIKSSYRGSVSSKAYKEIWEHEQHYNDHLFKTFVVSYHETRQEAYLKEEQLQTKLNVAKSSMYINKSIAKQKGWYGIGRFGKDNPMFGKSIPATPESRLRSHQIHKNKVVSEETKQLQSKIAAKRSRKHYEKVSISLSLRYSEGNIINPMLNKTHSDNAKQKIGDNSRQLKHSEITKQKMKERRQAYNGPVAWQISHPTLGKFFAGSLKAFCKEFNLNYSTVYTQQSVNKTHRSFSFRKIGKYIKLNLTNE